MEQNNRNSSSSEERIGVCICSVEHTYLAIEEVYVQQVLPIQPVTFVPGCPEYVRGVIYLRGKIESVIDPGLLVGMPKKEDREEGRILLVENDSVRTGIVFNTVEDIVQVLASQIEPPMSSLSDALKPIVIGSFTWQNRTILLLDIEKMLLLIQEGS